MLKTAFLDFVSSVVDGFLPNLQNYLWEIVKN